MIVPFDMETSAQLSPRALKYLPYLVATSFFMQMLDGTILNTALPSIARSFGCSALNLHSVVISYMLTVAVLIPASGWVSDKIGSRKTFILSTLLFCIGSICCAASPSVTVLCISRVVQGVGAAFLVPVGRLTILRCYPRDEFVRVMNMVTIPGLIGPLVGPMLGGFLSQHVSWHWIFLINVPIGAAGIWAATQFMPNLFADEKTKFDYKGYGLFILGAICLSMGLDTQGTGGESSRLEMILFLATGMAFLIAYWYYARQASEPIFNLRLFKTRNFTIGILGNLISRLGGSSMPYLMPLFFQLVLGYSAFKSGLSLLPLACGSIVIKFAIPPMLRHFGYRKVMVGNTLILGCLIGSFSLLTPQTSQWVLIALLSLLGMANSIQFTSMNTLTLVDLPKEDTSSGNSLLSVVMQLSMSLGIGLAAMLLEAFRTPATDTALERLESTFHSTFLVVGTFSIVTSLIFIRIGRNVGKNIK